MATFAYGRVSTTEQSSDNQRIEIEAAGHKVDFWFADTIGGKTSATQRPQFAALLGQIRNGETLVVAKLDRLGRDAQDVAPPSSCWPTAKSASSSCSWANWTSPRRPAR
jgi:DNA invertase Pin-like site-specific DNA recombinase